MIGRTGPDLLTAALEAVGLQRTQGMFERSYSLAGVGEPGLYAGSACWQCLGGSGQAWAGFVSSAANACRASVLLN